MQPSEPGKGHLFCTTPVGHVQAAPELKADAFLPTGQLYPSGLRLFSQAWTKEAPQFSR